MKFHWYVFIVCSFIIFPLFSTIHAQIVPLRTVTVTNTSQFTTALAQALPGDKIILSAGDYTGRFLFPESRSGTATAPITIQSNGRAKIIGALLLHGSYVTVQGLEITDPQNTVDMNGIDVWGSEVKVINNIIHDKCNNMGIAAFYEPGIGTGNGQVFYGNIIYNNGCNPQYDPVKGRVRHPHNIYTQNDGDALGAKIFENNIIFEPGCPQTDGCYSLHLYNQFERKITGFQFKDNIFSNAAIIIGGYDPPDNTLFSNNVLLGGNFQLGYPWETPVVPSQRITFSNNKFWNTRHNWIVASEVLSLQNNQFSGGSVSITTSPSNSVFTPLTVSGNTYTGSFSQKINTTIQGTLASNGTVSSSPVVIQNKYDPSLYYVAMPTSGTLSLSGQLTVYSPKDYFGSPVVTGTNQVSLNVGAYVVRVAQVVPSLTSSPQLLGDANGDTKVDGVDYIIWLNHYNQTGINEVQNGDFDTNNKVDGVDYIIWLTHYSY